MTLIPTGIAALVIFLFMYGLSPARANQQRLFQSNSIVVNTLSDEQTINGNCTLREAVTAANINYTVDQCQAGSTMTDTITFSVVGTISLTEQLPYIQNAGSMVIDGGLEISLTTSYKGRLVWVNPGARLALQELTILKSGFQGYDYTEDTNGGGIYNNQGIMTIDRCSFTNNTTWSNTGGAIFNSGTTTITQSIFRDNNSLQGGAIINTGSLTIRESSFDNNIATMWGSGGAISNIGMLEVSRSTFYHNTAENSGGGIANFKRMHVINSTFANNWVWDTGQLGGGGIDNSGMAEIESSTFLGGVKQTPGGTLLSINLINCTACLLTIKNSLLTSEPVITNCVGTMIDGGYNLDSQNTCGFDPANGSLVNTDPLLGALQNNGGSTLTYAPQPSSPAIDAADPLKFPASDQRGVPRPYDGDSNGEISSDIGAYEVVPPGIPRTTQTSVTSIIPKPALINQGLTINYQVSSAFGVPTGTVTVTASNYDQSCAGALTNGLGSCSLTISDYGTYTLTASYGGQGDYLPSSSSWVIPLHTYGAFLPMISREYPPPLEIVWSGIRPDQYGIYEMIGHVRNVSSEPLYAVTLSAILYDQAGGVIGTAGGTTALPTIFPDESIPFEFQIGYQAPNSYQLTPSWLDDPFPFPYYAVSVISQEISGTCPILTIQGEIRNDQQAELKGIQVIIEPGGAGDMYGVATLGQDTLLPDSTTAYTLTQNHIASPCPANYTVRGQGYSER